MTPWTIAPQAPLSMGILQARILDWVAMPFHGGIQGIFIPGTKPRSPTLQADSLLSEPPGKPSIDMFLLTEVHSLYDSPSGSVVKNPPANTGAVGLIPGSGRCPWEENGNPLQYSSLGNPMDGGA